jgi:hypothetical protein
MRVEFVSERKVVKSFATIPEALVVLEKVVEVYNNWQLSEDGPKVFFENVGKYLPLDPFLRLSMRVKKDNKIVYKKVIWKNTVK